MISLLTMIIGVASLVGATVLLGGPFLAAALLIAGVAALIISYDTRDE